MNGAHADAFEKLDAYIEETMQDLKIPGLAIAVVKDGSVLLAKGYGVREVAKRDPVDAHTLFAIGSNTKAFIATGLGLLMQEGKLTWDDPVTAHLPGFQLYDPYVTREITVRDLLCHRCGLATWGGDLLSYASSYTMEEVLRRVRHLAPAFSFRSGFGYCNLMFLAAGRIIAAITGAGWDVFIRRRFFQPLGMTRSNTSVRDLKGLDNVATPHTKVKGQTVTLPYRNTDNMGPAGAINSSAIEMAQWLRLQIENGAYDGHQVVEPGIVQETRTPHTPIPVWLSAAHKVFPSTHFLLYGLGWMLRDYEGRLVISHGGGIDGMCSQLAFMPEENLGVVVLTNDDRNYLYNVLPMYVFDAFIGASSQKWTLRAKEQWEKSEKERVDKQKKLEEDRVQGTRLTLELCHYAGKYESQVYGEATVTEQNGRLVLQLGAHPTITGELEHWHYDTFLCKWSDVVFDTSLVPFILDGQGKVDAFKVSVRQDMVDPLEYVFQRVSEPD